MSEDLRDTLNLECDCHSHMVTLQMLKDDCELYESLWYLSPKSESFFDRLKMAWHILKDGSELMYDVIWRPHQIVELRNWLNKMIESHNIDDSKVTPMNSASKTENDLNIPEFMKK